MRYRVLGELYRSIGKSELAVVDYSLAGLPEEANKVSGYKPTEAFMGIFRFKAESRKIYESYSKNMFNKPLNELVVDETVDEINELAGQLSSDFKDKNSDLKPRFQELNKRCDEYEKQYERIERESDQPKSRIEKIREKLERVYSPVSSLKSKKSK